MPSGSRAWTLLLAGLLAGISAEVQACPLFGPRTSNISPDTPKACDNCEAWSMPQAPFKVYGNTYYVGTSELSVILITTTNGLILLDGGLAQTAPQVEANLKTLGFDVKDVRWIFNTHAHYDHAGGIAALAQKSHAKVGAETHAVKPLKTGLVDPMDPQVGYGDFMAFAPAPRVEGFRNGQSITLGDVSLTLIATPGHTPGGASYTWKSCEPMPAAGASDAASGSAPTPQASQRCLTMVYADSLNPVAAPGFRYGGPAPRPSADSSRSADSSQSAITDALKAANATPRVVEFRNSIATVAALPCDIILSAHPGFSGTMEKLEKRNAGQADAFIDPQGCKAYAAESSRRLDDRLARELSPTPP